MWFLKGVYVIVLEKQVINRMSPKLDDIGEAPLFASSDALLSAPEEEIPDTDTGNNHLGFV